MDTNGDQHHPECLTCPLCIEAFKQPTLLRCGHTFCEVCLEGYDEQHHGVDHMECPVCRKRTKLDESRVAGLSPNFTVKGLQEELHVDEGVFPNLCLLHKTEHRNIFCEVCEKFICITCFIKNHQGHKIIKKEDLKEELKKKKVTLIEESKTRKQQIEKFVIVAEKKRKEMHGHFSDMEGEIRDAYDEKVATLQANKKKLIEAVNNIRRDSDRLLRSSIADERLLIDNIDISVGILTANNSQHLTDDILIEDHVYCIDLEQSLKKANDEQAEQPTCMEQVQAELNSQFLPASGKLLDLGLVEIGGKASTSNGQHAMTPARVNTNADEAQPSTSGTVGRNPAKVSGRGEGIPATVSGKEGGISATVPNKSLTIVKETEMPEGRMYGMAAISRDSVVVGYKTGSDCFSVSSEKKPHLISEKEYVCDIACISDGRTVASSSDSVCRVYDARGILTGVQYACTKPQVYLCCPKICSDQHDNIYAINGNPEIYIFRGDCPRRVIPTEKRNPYRICVTKTGSMIVCSCHRGKSVRLQRTVSVYDKDGNIGSTINSNNVMDEWLYAAVDSQDRVLVARVRDQSDMLRLTRYTLEGTTLIKDTLFKPLRLPHQMRKCPFNLWCYMASPAPNMLAFSDRSRLYFIELAV